MTSKRRKQAGMVKEASVQLRFAETGQAAGPTNTGKAMPGLIAESRERLQSYGAAALSPPELLSLLLNAEAGAVWYEYRSLAALARAPWQELIRLPGMGRAAVCRWQAALELGRRLAQEERGHRPQIHSPADAVDLLMPEMRDLEQEQLRVLLLDTKNRVIAIETVYIGNVNSSIVRIGEILRPAIRVNATAIILAHNHPSGDPTPSPEDARVSRSLVEAGQLMGIEVLDHLVIGHNRFTSLKERGLGF